MVGSHGGRRSVRILGVLVLIALAVALSGCISIQSDDAGQVNVIGDVEVVTTTQECDWNGPNGASCPPTNYHSTTPTGPSMVDAFLLAYRIKDGVGAPDVVFAAEGDSMALRFNKSYSDSLNAVAPAPAGEHWVGYRSNMFPNLPKQTSTFKPHFTLPQSDGKAFQGPFVYRTVVGFIQDTSPNGGGKAPVECGTPPTSEGPKAGDGSQSVCINSPVGTEYTTDKQVATRDLALTSAGNGTGLQNASATLPFSAQFAGAADPSASFQISASTDAPGVHLAPSATTLTPDSDSTTPIAVKADVPPTTPLGTYDVKLVASLPNGVTRSATAKLTVALGKPVNLRLPEITGTSAVGKTVNCESGGWSSSPGTFAYQWTRDASPISGATSQTYALTQADGALLVACSVTASNDAGSGQATSGPIRVAQAGGADVTLDGKPAVKRRADGTYDVDTGITVSCPPRLPANCGGGNHIDADASAANSSASAVRALQVAAGGFAAKTGKQQHIVLHLTGRGSKLLDRNGKLSLVARVITRNHLMERVVSKKRFTIRRPH
jgi:hypothetical protein